MRGSRGRKNASSCRLWRLKCYFGALPTAQERCEGRRPSYEKGLPCFPRRAEAHERGATSCQCRKAVIPYARTAAGVPPSTTGDPRLCRGGSKSLTAPAVCLQIQTPGHQRCSLKLVILTLGRGKAPLRGPRPVKPPALPEDTYTQHGRQDSAWRIASSVESVAQNCRRLWGATRAICGDGTR